VALRAEGCHERIVNACNCHNTSGGAGGDVGDLHGWCGFDINGAWRERFSILSDCRRLFEATPSYFGSGSQKLRNKPGRKREKPRPPLRG